jgi:hypothetical protein
MYMDIKDSLLVGTIILIVYWYFNIRGVTKCIIYNRNCKNIRCIKEKNN